MNLVYFKSDIGNFGDDLNAWLWKQLLGDLDAYQKDVNFVGIGSILDERINSDIRTVVFGSGVRDFNLNIKEFNILDVSFVRGPISSKVLGGCPYITDSAYALRLLPQNEYKKKYKTSFVPYFRHFHQFNWSLFEKTTGIHVIDPTQHVETVIKEINESESILAAAMHGAILADLYRIPWMRVKFSQHGVEPALTSELKWADWLLSIGITEAPTVYFGFTLNYKIGKIKQWLYLLIIWLKFRKPKFTLSSKERISEIDSQIKNALQKLKQDFLR